MGKKTLQLNNTKDNGLESLTREVNEIRTEDSKDNAPKYTTAPDGTKYPIREVKELNQSGLKLQMPSHLKEPGYHYVWAIDRGSMGYQSYVDMGYTFVEGSPSVYGGTKVNNEPYYHVLMKIPLELHQERQSREQREIEEKEQAQLKPQEKGLHVPDGYNNTIGQR
jgi:hypothetical protein